MNLLYKFCLLALLVTSHTAFSDAALTIHDAHIHYDQDVWQALPVDQALKMLSEVNIQRTLVSATPTEGAEKLYKENPHMVIPMLRPYKSWRHRYLWFKDPGLKSYLLEHMERVPYRGFGEFHVFGKDANTPQVEEMIELARQHKMVIHPHTDLEGMQIILKKSSGLVVIWAHGGFDVPVKTLKYLLDNNPMLYIELSFREGMLTDEHELTSEWKRFLINYQKRFLIGMDTYKPSRWANLAENIEAARLWLGQLPEDVAVDIARNNLDRLFP